MAERFETDTYSEMIRGARLNDSEAISKLFSDFEPEIRRFVRFRLTSPRIRRLIESVDISQSVFRKFFVDIQGDGHIPESVEQLRRLLLTMAKNKILDKVRNQNASKRDSRRMDGSGDEALQVVAADSMSPDQALETEEVLEQIRQSVTAEEYELLNARAAGKSWGELAEQHNTTSEAIRKRVTRLMTSVRLKLSD